MAAVVALEDVGEDARERALECADADRSGLAACEIEEILPGDRDSGRQLVDVAREDEAGLGEGHLCAAGGALEQALSDDLLQGRDLLADGRLGVAEHLGASRERARLGDRRKRGEMPEVEAWPKITHHDDSKGIGLAAESYVWPGWLRSCAEQWSAGRYGRLFRRWGKTLPELSAWASLLDRSADRTEMRSERAEVESDERRARYSAKTRLAAKSLAVADLLSRLMSFDLPDRSRCRHGPPRPDRRRRKRRRRRRRRQCPRLSPGGCRCARW